MKSSLRRKLETLSLRVEEVSALLSSEDITRDLDRYRALIKEHAEIEPVTALYRQYQEAEADLTAAHDMTADPEMKAYADDEITAIKARLEAIEAELQQLLLPTDPDDERNVFLEIRAGT